MHMLSTKDWYALLAVVVSLFTLPFTMSIYDATLWHALGMYIGLGLITMLIAFPLVRRFHVRYRHVAKHVNHFQAFAFGVVLMGLLMIIATIHIAIVAPST